MRMGVADRERIASVWRAARGFWRRLSPSCQHPGCPRNRRVWRGVRRRERQIVFEGGRYCAGSCLERALRSTLAKACGASARPVVHHRIPLGLLMVSRQQLTGEQLRSALAAQRAAGHGRIGQWLQQLGYASEAQVTAALARQWSCPILRGETLGVGGARAPQLPLTLMRWLAIAPVDFVESTRTLHVAFAGGLDYTVLYAIGQMLGCRTEPCLVRPSLLERHFMQLAESRTEGEVRFEHINDVAELARMIGSYAVRLTAGEIRFTKCGLHLWVRLLRDARPPVDLIAREIRNVTYSSEPASSASGGIAV